MGCALSARAACELRDQARIDTTTIARLRHALDHGAQLERGGSSSSTRPGWSARATSPRSPRRPSTPRPSSCSSATTASCRRSRRVERSARSPTRLGAARAARGPPPATSRGTATRSPHCVDGDVDGFARAYHEHGRLVAAPTADAARAALVNDWWDAHRARRAGADDRPPPQRRRRPQRARPRADARGRRASAPRRSSTATGPSPSGTASSPARNDRPVGVVNGETGQLTALPWRSPHGRA